MILPDACRVNIQPARKACSISAELLLNLCGIHAQFRRFGCAFSAEYAYSKEELVAEIGASALVNHVGLETSNSLRNNVAYIQNWLRVLKDDKRFIVSASGRAEKAVNLILGSVG